MQAIYKIDKDSLNAWGYVLFWLAYRNFYLEENDIVNVEWNADIDASLNFALGVTKQKWFNVRQCIAKKFYNKCLLQMVSFTMK